MNRAAFAAFNASRLDAQYETFGEPVIFPGRNGLTVTGCASPVQITALVVEGGDEIEIERSLRIRISEFPDAPRRWELLKIGTRDHCIAALTIDVPAGEYLLQLANANLAAQFS
jgi:hypothetical protein